ncbi:MAG: hypothetical protein HYS44_00395 [Candidatus Niyogibacteria bacterium]|nr:hypothetical protein [Candidatus Niyogibacteria bacterium]
MLIPLIKRGLLGIGACAVIAFAALASSPDDIGYPVAELGNCASEAKCRTYCDDRDNARPCLAFARQYHLMPEKDIDRFEKLLDGLTDGGPGGCTSQGTCETYCNDIGHIEECVAFGEKHGVLKGEQLTEARRVRDALRRGIKPPGGCKNRDACETFCSEPTNIEECVMFGRAAGVISEAESKEITRILPFIKSGQMPGGCRTKEQCEAYCDRDAHFGECVAFAERAGFISSEELEIARKTNGKGPGGCKRNACKDFCGKPENQQACFEFAAERGLISEEDLVRMYEGRQQLQKGLAEASPELRSCVESALGAAEIAGIVGGPEIGVKLRECFESQKTAENRKNLTAGPSEEFTGVSEANDASEEPSMREENREQSGNEEFEESREEQSFDESEPQMSRAFVKDEEPFSDAAEEPVESKSSGFFGALLAPFVDLLR